MTHIESGSPMPKILTHCPRESCLAAALVSLLLFASIASAQSEDHPPANSRVSATFSGLGFLSGGDASHAVAVSANGDVIVGYASAPSEATWEAFRWEDGEMIGLGHLKEGSPYYASDGHAISADGNVVVGNSTAQLEGGFIQEAYRWDDKGMAGLGHRPGSSFSSALDVSADGTIVIGFSAFAEAEGAEAYWWQGGNFMPLGHLPGGRSSTMANAVSADGSVIVGSSVSGNGVEAFRWEADTIEGLGDLPGGLFWSEAYDISADGTTIVGSSESGGGAFGYEAFRWTAGAGMVGLGTFEENLYHSAAQAVSADGSIIVGHSIDTDLVDAAFIWTEKDGIRRLKQVLENDHGLDLGGWTLYAAYGVSDDGTVIVGQGVNPDGFNEGWRAVLPRHMSGILEVTPAELDFGQVQIGEMSTLSLEIANAAPSSATSLLLSALIIDSPFAITGGDCAVGVTLDAGENCLMEVTFAPPEKGQYAGTIHIETADGQSESAGLHATGIEPGSPDIFHDRFEAHPSAQTGA